MPGPSPNPDDARRLRQLRSAMDAAYPEAPGAPTRGIEVVRAPGCVNLMGDDTEYNDGFVLPVAVGLDTWLAYRRRPDGLVRVVSAQDAAACSFWIDDVAPERRGRFGSWFQRVEGIAWSLREAGLAVHGLDGVVDSTVPADGCLGSSAALELAAALALLGGARALERPSLAALAQRAEHDYAGGDGGIMDQYASALGNAGRAILLDCRSLESRYVTLPHGLSLVVCDTGWRPSGRSALVAERRAECGRAVALIAERVPSIASLRDLDRATLRRQSHFLPDALVRRAEHVIAENERVLTTAGALETGDLDTLGRAFAASHESLRSLYEVGSPATDALIEIALSVRGVIAARMTDAGSGGWTVNLVLEEAVPALQATVAREYPARTGLDARVYPVAVVDAAGLVATE
ncbi:MAG TPA: galactokinase [Candidatus Limnocylindrales bacterium]